jgi:hypothetical protein
MNYDLNFNVEIEPLTQGKILSVGSDFENANVVIRSSENEKLLYIDGACEGDAPLFLGITKSRGTQEKKLPVQSNDFLGGIHIYARKEEGSGLGYCPNETPLVAGIQFKVSNNTSSGIPTEMLLALSDESGMSVKLIVDKNGNLRTTGSLSTGTLTITDETIEGETIQTFVRATYNGRQYAIPLYSIRNNKIP